MKTKIAIFSFLLVLGFISSSYSQFYVKVGVGYGLGIATSDSYVEGSDVKYISYGEGIYPRLGFGYVLNKNMAVELNGSYLIGKKFEDTDTLSGGATITQNFWGQGIFISPALVVMAPVKNLTAYARFGGVIGIPTVKVEVTSTLVGGTYKAEETGNLASGVTGAFGVMFKAGNKINIFAELYGTAMNYRPEKLENTETFSGSTIDPMITYVESLPVGTNQAIAPSRPFSNYGLNIGINYVFGKTPKK